jgi:DNA-binding beta-propeller fold protein YncE
VHGLSYEAGAVSVLDATSGALLTTLPVGIRPAAVAVDDSTQRVLVLNNEGTVSVFNTRVGGPTLRVRTQPSRPPGPGSPSDPRETV